MNDPVTRLEQWCADAERWDVSNGIEPEALPIAVYLRMIAEYRELVELYGEFDSAYTSGGIAVLRGAITDLANALVPKETQT